MQVDSANSKNVERYHRKPVEYKLQSGDNIYIKFSSTEPVSNIALSTGNNIGISQSMAAKYKDIYLVDSAGYVSLTQLNKVFVRGLSIRQLKDSLEYKMKSYFQQVTAQVRLADNYVTIIGHVNNPGRYLIDFNDKISIFELIGMAGDLSFEANRKDVKLLRNIGEETEVVSLDLTKRSILEDKYYYVMPNDIIYIEPLKAITWHQKSFPFTTTLTLLLSTTASILVILSYLK